MAIRVLLDHDVPEDRIIFLTFLATPLGKLLLNILYFVCLIVKSLFFLYTQVYM